MILVEIKTIGANRWNEKLKLWVVAEVGETNFFKTETRLRPELAKIRDPDWERAQEVGKIRDRDWDPEKNETDKTETSLTRLRPKPVSRDWD